jgi:chitodextrinase
MERWAEYYYLTKDAKIKPILDKWVAWVTAHTTVGTGGTFSIPSTLTWTGAPDTWNAASPGANASLHVTVADSGQDVGVAAGLVKALLYYAAGAGNTAAQTLGKNLLDALSAHTDTKGIAIPETRTDYNRFDDTVYVPSGWTGKMPNGDPIAAGSTFISIRSFYKNDPDYAKVQTYLNGGAVPSFTYHRFWAQADIAMAFAVYSELFGSGGGTGTGDTTAPTAPTGLTVSGTTSSTVSLSWTASTDNTAVTGYLIYRAGTQVGTSTTTTYVDSGLTASTAYAYTVKARDAANNLSAASSSVTGTTTAGTGTGTGTVTATYHVDNDWGSGFTATVTVKNGGTAAIKGWKVTWTWAGTQQLTNAWNATAAQSGKAVSVTNASYNGALAAGASTTFGFQGTYTGSNAAPTLTASGS